MTTQTLGHSLALVSTPKIARAARFVARALLGLTFLSAGASFFLHLAPQPSGPMPAAVAAFTSGLAQSGYMFPLVMGTQLVGGALLVANRFVPLALVLLAPVLVNILAFHAFLAPAGLGTAIVLCALEAGLAWSYRAAFRGVLSARAA